MNFLKNATSSTTSLSDALSSILDKVTENPKVTVAASTASTFAGVATAAQWLTGVAAGAAIFASLVATIALARLHWLRGEQSKIEAEKARLEIEELRKKLSNEGVKTGEENGQDSTG